MSALNRCTSYSRLTIRFAAERLTSLVRTLELTNIDEHYALQKVASFGTLIATYEKGFLLILEPYETEHATVPNPIFHTVLVHISLAWNLLTSRLQMPRSVVGYLACFRTVLIRCHHFRNDLASRHVPEDASVPTSSSPLISHDATTKRFLPDGHHSRVRSGAHFLPVRSPKRPRGRAKLR